jgi:tetrachlorobenzoquinone reductase
MSETLREVRLEMVRYLSATVNLYEFGLLDEGPLNHQGPGSHIDLHLPYPNPLNPTVRQYSLVALRNDACVIAVQRGAGEGSASRVLHDKAKVGEHFHIGAVRNNFELAAHASHSIFIAGGIGVTPMLPMLEQLEAQGASWELHYASSETPVAFAGTLQRYGSKVRYCSGSAPGPDQLDIAKLAREADAASTLYCCGPQRMLDAFRQETRGFAEGRAHLESFQASEPAATEGGFVVVLERQGRQVNVKHGQTIIECLAEAGVLVPSSCLQGICGACETRVLSGRPDHRDGILSDSERAANNTMMICCSGSLDARLVLDL